MGAAIIPVGIFNGATTYSRDIRAMDMVLAMAMVLATVTAALASALVSAVATVTTIITGEIESERRRVVRLVFL